MRNDAHDEINDLPSLNAARTNSPKHTESDDSYAPYTTQPDQQIYSYAPQSNKAVGLLSALTLALLCASGTFVWWSMQRMQLLEQQLVATQDSFSRISEDAAGRIKDISGKFSATESSVLSNNETLKMRLNKLESVAVETTKQQQISLTAQTAHLTKISAELANLQETSGKLQTATAQQQQAFEQQKNTLNALQTDLSTRLEQQLQHIAKLQKSSDANQQLLAQLPAHDKTLQGLTAQLNKLQKNTVSNDELTRLQQDMLILRTELEQRPAPASNQGPSLSDFDAYRAQTNRTIAALQEQVRNLQKNTP